MVRSTRCNDDSRESTRREVGNDGRNGHIGDHAVLALGHRDPPGQAPHTLGWDGPGVPSIARGRFVAGVKGDGGAWSGHDSQRGGVPERSRRGCGCVGRHAKPLHEHLTTIWPRAHLVPRRTRDCAPTVSVATAGVDVEFGRCSSAQLESVEVEEGVLTVHRVILRLDQHRRRRERRDIQRRGLLDRRVHRALRHTLPRVHHHRKVGPGRQRVGGVHWRVRLVRPGHVDMAGEMPPRREPHEANLVRAKLGGLGRAGHLAH
mmetsp:Transcript_22685/g.68314  ORF Transcript_22685/g.68314 Transcript_22685/m.68314 type:complete len:261 (-) Transcript_22685:537-1319(-)